MARTEIAAQNITAGGAAPTYQAATLTGNSIRLDHGRLLHVKNAGAAAVNLTIPTPGTVGGLDIADRTVTVAAGGEQMVALAADPVYLQSDGYAYLNFDVVTSVTVALFAVP